MADLLLELFSEEIPARMQAAALEHLQSTLSSTLKAERVKGFVTPRRVAVIIENLPPAQPDITTELKGPKVGAPEAALQGFLKKTGLSIAQLEQRDGVYFANIHQKGRPTADILKETIEKTLAEFPWPKSMRWGSGSTSWVRPLHSILCLFDNKVVPVEFAGVNASDITHGHRFLSPDPIAIKRSSDYANLLRAAKVIADREERKAKILLEAEKLAAAKGLTLRNDPGLLEEVTGLVEWPVLLMGKIDDRFVDLPKEVLVTVMRSHQKYFALEKADGTLAPEFLITANMETHDGGKAITAGNERVLRARFSDARFFWDQDRKKALSDWAKGLKDVTFHARLGTVADKVARIGILAAEMSAYVKGADKTQVDRAAQLCKADLVTGMVGEFAELQGIMGRYYAQGQKEAAPIADAIRDHYKPQGPSDSVPSGPVSVCVALADKLDTLVSMFAIGEKPTGSKDPFALRRAALGVIRIVLENNIRLPLSAAFDNAPLKDIAVHSAHEKLVKKTEARLQEQAPGKVGKYLSVNESACEDIPEGAAESLGRALLAFFHDRLIVQLKDQGIRHDVIKAVVSGGDDDLVRIVARARALQDFLGSDDGANLLVAYKRAANILAIEEKKDKTTYKAADLKASSLKEKEETALSGDLAKSANDIENLCKSEQFVEAMKTLSGLRTPVDQFFEKTMVNCEDKELRANRLRLLADIRDSMNRIANFALIEG